MIKYSLPPKLQRFIRYTRPVGESSRPPGQEAQSQKYWVSTWQVCASPPVEKPANITKSKANRRMVFYPRNEFNTLRRDLPTNYVMGHTKKRGPEGPRWFLR